MIPFLMKSLTIILSKNLGLNSDLRIISRAEAKTWVTWSTDEESSENPLKTSSGYVRGTKKGWTAGNGLPPRDPVKEVWERIIFREKRRMSKS